MAVFAPLSPDDYNHPAVEITSTDISRLSIIEAIVNNRDSLIFKDSGCINGKIKSVISKSA